MATDPSIALQARDPMQLTGQITQQAGQFLQLQNLMNQNQLGGLQVQQQQQDQQDQQTLRQLQMSGQYKDLSSLADAAAQQGVSPKTVQALKMQGVDYQGKVATIAKNLSETAKTNGEVGKQVLDAQNSMATDLGKLGLDAIQDKTYNQDKWNQGLQQIQRKYSGVIPQATLNAGIQPYTQFSPDVAGAVITKARTYQDAHDAAFGKTVSDSTGISQQYPPAQPGGLPTVKSVVSLPQTNVGKANWDSENGNITPGQAKTMIGNELLNPIQIEGAKIKLQQQLNPSAVAGVAPHLVSAATSAYEKSGEKLAEAQSAANDMQTFIDSARAGNKVAYAYAPVEGVLTLNTGRGVKRVNMSEIESYGGAGSVADKVKGFLGKQTSGASIPPEILNDMETLHSTIAQNAQDLHAKSVQVINGTYGSKFQPMNLGKSGATPQPVSQVHTATGADGTKYVLSPDGKSWVKQ